jgi:hypothetical protein
MPYSIAEFVVWRQGRAKNVASERSIAQPDAATTEFPRFLFIARTTGLEIPELYRDFRRNASDLYLLDVVCLFSMALNCVAGYATLIASMGAGVGVAALYTYGLRKRHRLSRPCLWTPGRS